eukprot:CAMPEP_0117616122 /NCGR_PEP_ID=MMETSP0784-20121206/84884_1 /TAXON_ID=39447 /ORGANISM="" /LENGTH=200 /DNA_ID=CAMNT_0005419863 /DNA_START=64 /DNA_END=664 /DNA_ORIENTATION=-
MDASPSSATACPLQTRPGFEPFAETLSTSRRWVPVDSVVSHVVAFVAHFAESQTAAEQYTRSFSVLALAVSEVAACGSTLARPLKKYTPLLNRSALCRWSVQNPLPTCGQARMHVKLLGESTPLAQDKDGSDGKKPGLHDAWQSEPELMRFPSRQALWSDALMIPRGAVQGSGSQVKVVGVSVPALHSNFSAEGEKPLLH